MQTFQPRLEILPAMQQHIWPILAPSASMGFVLYGGTALALQLGHRISVDFDFFSDLVLDKNGIFAAFSCMQEANVEQDAKNTLSVKTSSGVKLSFFGGIDFGRVGEPLLAAGNSVWVASLDDLMATKLKVLFDRIECKDYTDIAAMLRSGVDLSKGLAAARAMYGGSFQPSEALKAMTYFKGGDLAELRTEDQEMLLDAARKVKSLPKVHTISRSLVGDVGTGQKVEP